MSILHDDSLPVNCILYPPELDDLSLLDFFADDDAPGLLAVEVLPERDAPAEPRLPFPELIAHHAAYYRTFGTEYGDWLASKLDELAATARALHATSPTEFDDRQDVMDADQRHAQMCRDFDAGWDAGRACR